MDMMDFSLIGNLIKTKDKKYNEIQWNQWDIFPTLMFGFVNEMEVSLWKSNFAMDCPQ